MNEKEWGLCLLCCALPGDRPLTPAQYRTLQSRVCQKGIPPVGEVSVDFLQTLGYDLEEAGRICALLQREERLHSYLEAGERLGIRLLTRLSPYYPRQLHRKLGVYAPAVFFYAGNPALLETLGVGLVGSRKLLPPGVAFAERVGALAAKEGLTLVSGNAVGADRVAQDACLQKGGCVISFLADELSQHLQEAGERHLLISSQGWDLPFSMARALQRNHYIHAFGEKTFVAQSDAQSGGTWDGTVKNLRDGYSHVFVHADGSLASKLLMDRGATPIALDALTSISTQESDQQSFL